MVEFGTGNAWSRGMYVIVCLVLIGTLTGVTSGDISWSHGLSPISLTEPKLTGSFQSYEARIAHDKAKYYAKKAHDLAKLRSSIYGIGHGLYGFRYGSHFPGHFSKSFSLSPLVDKSSVSDFGLYKYPFSSHFPQHGFSSLQTPSLSGISSHLTGFGYPQPYRKGYSQSYSYGKGYSYGNKNSYGTSKPYSYEYSNVKSFPPLPLKYKIKIPEKSSYHSGYEPQSHGHQYYYIKENPKHSIDVSSYPAYDAIYGVKYNNLRQGSEYKSPEENIEYVSSIPINSGHDILIPSSGVIQSEEHGGHSYIPVDASSYGSIDDFDSDIDSHQLVGYKAPVHSFDSSDLIAYGSEKIRRRN